MRGVFRQARQQRQCARHRRRRISARTWIELPLLYPVTTEIDKDAQDYRDADRRLLREVRRSASQTISSGRTVAVLSEGDPLFYGSYMHLHVRLAHRYPTEVDSRRHGDVRLLVADRPADRAGRRRADRAAGHDGRVRADAPAGRHRRRGHHEGRPQPAQDPPGAGRRPASSTRAIYVERGTMANTQFDAAGRQGRRRRALFLHRAGAGLGRHSHEPAGLSLSSASARAAPPR